MRPAIPAVIVLACALPASAAAPPAGVIRVAVTYPGADARTVDETALVPLFREINGVRGMTRSETEARNDGTGTLTVFFTPDTDMDLAELRVHNRVAVALPRIPEPCRQLGVSVRALPAGPPAFWLALTSTDDAHDTAFLQNLAWAHVVSEFARTPGVADVRVVGVGEIGVWVSLRPDRLAAHKLMPGDVVDTLRRQNAQVAGRGAVDGLSLRYPVTASGRLTTLDQFTNVILRATPAGEVLRLRDVAEVEFGAARGGFARVDGRPAALIAVTAWPEATADQFRKAAGVADLPAGVRLDVVADRAADRLVTVEVRVPEGAPPDWTAGVVGRATDPIRGLPGKPGTTAFTDGREPSAVTILVKPPARGGPTAEAVDKALAEVPNAAIRVSGVPPGGTAFPVRIALTDPAERDEARLYEAADRVVAGLARDPNVTAVAAFPGPAVPQYAVDVDRERCAALGVGLDDLFTTLRAALDGVYATDFHKFGLSLRVTVQADPKFVRTAEDLTDLKVRTAAGEMVSLGTVVKVRKALGPATVVRVNGYRATIVTAEPAAGQTPAAAAARCVKLARDGLPVGYRAEDLTGPPR